MPRTTTPANHTIDPATHPGSRKPASAGRSAADPMDTLETPQSEPVGQPESPAEARTAVPASDSVEAAYAALAEARVALDDAEVNAEIKAQDLAVLDRRTDRGDPTITAEDYSAAQFEARRSTGAVETARRAIKDAETNVRRAIAEHEPVLARAFANSFGPDAWPWSSLSVVLGKPVPDAPANTLFAWQDAPVKFEADGTLSGTLDLQFATSGLHGGSVLALLNEWLRAHTKDGYASPTQPDITSDGRVRLVLNHVTDTLPWIVPGTVNPGGILAAIGEAVEMAYARRHARDWDPAELMRVTGHGAGQVLDMQSADNIVITRIKGTITAIGPFAQCANDIAGISLSCGRVLSLTVTPKEPSDNMNYMAGMPMAALTTQRYVYNVEAEVASHAAFTIPGVK